MGTRATNFFARNRRADTENRYAGAGLSARGCEGEGGMGRAIVHSTGCLFNLAQNRISGPMAQMNVSIPQALKGWAEARVAEGRYSSTSDYIRDLVRRDQEAEEAKRRLQAAIDEGFASPESGQSVDALFGELLAKG